MSSRSKKKQKVSEDAASSEKVPAIKWARGFRPPTPAQVAASLGQFPGEDIPSQFIPHPALYSPLPQPLSKWDWLATQGEDGQTYGEFLQQTPWLSGQRRIRGTQGMAFNPKGKTMTERYPEGCLYMVSLGGSSGTPFPTQQQLADYLDAFYEGVPVKLLNTIQIEEREKSLYLHPPSAEAHPTADDDVIDLTAASSSSSSSSKKSGKGKGSSASAYPMAIKFRSEGGRRQLDVDSVLRFLGTIRPPNALCLIAFTEEEFFSDPTDLFVAGMASPRGVACFSFSRYDPWTRYSEEFWYDRTVLKRAPAGCPLAERIKQILLRSCRLLSHEMAHMLGLDHCIHYACIMNGSGNLEEDIRQPTHLCPVCARKLHTLIDYDGTARNQKLLAFFEQHGMKEEEEWTRRAIQLFEEPVAAPQREDKKTEEQVEAEEKEEKPKATSQKGKKRVIDVIEID